MSIWHNALTLKALNQRSQNTMAEFLGIEFVEVGDNFLKAVMPVTEKIKQPIGIVHGGANVVLAETIASTAANCVINIETHYCVGLEINANHIRSIREGIITGITKPIHLGRTTQVWQITLFNEAQKITCGSRMTAAVIART